MCMADDSFGRRIPFAFLQDIKEKFLTQYGRERALSSLVPYGMNEFSKTIAKQMVRYLTCNNSINAYPHTRSLAFNVSRRREIGKENGWMQMEGMERMEHIGSNPGYFSPFT